MTTKEPAAITSTEFAKDETKQVQVGADPKVTTIDKAAGEDMAAAKQQVRVRALRTFHEGPNMTGEMVKPDQVFTTTRDRAVQLRQNGLIEYEDESLAKKIHGEESHAVLETRVADRAKAEVIPDSAKGTPLQPPPAIRMKAEGDDKKK